MQIDNNQRCSSQKGYPKVKAQQASAINDGGKILIAAVKPSFYASVKSTRSISNWQEIPKRLSCSKSPPCHYESWILDFGCPPP